MMRIGQLKEKISTSNLKREKSWWDMTDENCFVLVSTVSKGGIENAKSPNCQTTFSENIVFVILC